MVRTRLTVDTLVKTADNSTRHRADIEWFIKGIPFKLQEPFIEVYFKLNMDGTLSIESQRYNVVLHTKALYQIKTHIKKLLVKTVFSRPMDSDETKEIRTCTEIIGAIVRKEFPGIGIAGNSRLITMLIKEFQSMDEDNG